MKKLILLLALLVQVTIVPHETFATVAETASRADYNGNGTTTTFVYPWRIVNSGHLRVLLDGVVQTINTHYTVSGVGAATGSVVFLSAPTNGSRIVILRNQPLAQSNQYLPGGGFPASRLERDLDQNIMVDQMQAEEIDRSLRYGETQIPTAALTTVPTPVAGKCVGWDSAGTSLAANDCSGGGGGGSQHSIDSVNLTANDPVNFQDSATIDFTNPSAGNIQAAVKDNSISTAKIQDDAVTYAKLPNATASRLLGRGSAAGSGDLQEITLGTNLSMSGTTLNASGGAGSTHSIDGVNLTTQDPVNFRDTATIDVTNPSAGNVEFTVKAGSVTDAMIAAGGVTTRTKLPSAVAYEDETNTFTQTQNFNAQIVVSNQGIEFTESDTNPPCAAGNYNLYADLSEARIKKCENGTATVIGGTETDTLATVVARGRQVTDANSFANGVHIGLSTTSGWRIYDHVSNGPTFTCVVGGTENACNKSVSLNTGFYWDFIYNANSIFRFDFSQATSKLKWGGSAGIRSGDRPLGTIAWPAGAITTDGALCAAPTEQTINSGPKLWAFSCADNNGSIMYGNSILPEAYDGGTLLFQIQIWHGTTETITFAGDFDCQIRGDGEVPSSTWGTAVAADVAITTANQTEFQKTTAVTCAGTPAGGKMLYWRYVVDAANFSANAANSKVLGVKVEYSKSSFSD